MAKGDDLHSRFIDFAVLIIHITEHLPKTYACRHIAEQIVRSGTSPAANYGEARGAESKKDFIHKLRIVLKELNETTTWLAIIHRAHFSQREDLGHAINECTELSKIINASIKTTQDGE